jgi:hypothetical protein
LTSNSGTDVEEEMAVLSSPQVAVSSIEIVETPWGPRIRTRIVEGRLLDLWWGLRSTSCSPEVAMEYYDIVYKVLFA